MSVEKITEKILADARAEAQRMVEQARAQALEIEEKGERQAQTEAGRILEQAKADARELLARRSAILDLELRKNILASKRTVLQDTYERAKKSVLGNPETYAGLMYQMMLECAEAEDGTVLAADAWAVEETVKAVRGELARRGIARTIGIEEGHREIRDGFIYRLGRMDVNCTLDALFRGIRDCTETEVSGILFE